MGIGADALVSLSLRLPVVSPLKLQGICGVLFSP